MRREEDPGLLEPQSSQPRPLGHLCPSICPRSDSGTRALNIAASPGEGFRCQPGRPGPRLPAPRLPTRSAPGCSAHVGRGGRIPEHYLIHLAEGSLRLISASATKTLSVSLTQRGPWPPTIPSRVRFLLLLLLFHRPAAAWAAPIAHRMVERRRQVGGSCPPEREKVKDAGL